MFLGLTAILSEKSNTYLLSTLPTVTAQSFIRTFASFISVTAFLILESFPEGFPALLLCLVHGAVSTIRWLLLPLGRLVRACVLLQKFFLTAKICLQTGDLANLSGVI